VPAYGIVGAQWGDEGKGKIVDFLAESADMVVRYSGGSNAGHTVINEKGEFALHLIPSGIFRTNVDVVIGPGVVVDVPVLLSELENLHSMGVDTNRLLVSDRAHVVMPYHIMLDQLEEKERGGNAIGTTGRGIGPTYVDKVARVGIRVGDLLDPTYLSERLNPVLSTKNRILEKIYESDPINFDELYKEALGWGEALRPYISSVEKKILGSLSKGEKIVLEGAQGAMLDLDHGTYPFVTSSSVSIGGACNAIGIPPNQIAGIIGVYKAYSSRVGAGPMPSELHDSMGHEIREKAWEYGTTTGRPRRVGWFDGITAKYSAIVNGFTSAVLTRLDVLDGINPIKICVGYEIDGKKIDYLPTQPKQFNSALPIWEEMPGWSSPTAGATDIHDLPEEALNYINRLEEIIGCSFDVISTGPKRDESIIIRPIVTS